jgi:hypothetical protein
VAETDPRDGTVELASLTTLIRSKNAGPFHLTFDIMFDSVVSYHIAKASRVLTARTIAEMYGCAVDEVRAFDCPNIQAMKFTIPRPQVQGAFGDADLHGGQQYAPLMHLRIPRVRLVG